MTNNPYAKIKQNSVMTASPQELTLMLYNGAIKFGNQAIDAINHDNIELAHEKIIRVDDIVLEFIASLDHNYSIADEMEELYQFMHRQLEQANLNKDAKIVEQVVDLLREFRDTWKQVMSQVKNPETAKQMSKVAQ